MNEMMVTEEQQDAPKKRRLPHLGRRGKLIAGALAVARGQARFDAANLTALGFIFAGIVLVVVGYEFFERREHPLPRIRRPG